MELLGFIKEKFRCFPWGVFYNILVGFASQLFKASQKHLCKNVLYNFRVYNFVTGFIPVPLSLISPVDTGTPLAVSASLINCRDCLTWVTVLSLFIAWPALG